MPKQTDNSHFRSPLLSVIPPPRLPVPLTFVLHHVGLQLSPVALQRVAGLLQPADDWLRGAAAVAQGLRGAAGVAVVDGARRGAGARRVAGRGARGVARRGAEAVGEGVEGGRQDLVLVVQAVGVQLLVAEGAAPQRVARGARAPPGGGGRVVLP